MEFMSQFLPILLYFLLAVLLVVCIVFVIKLLGTLSKVDTLLEDVNKKLSTLDKVFDVVDTVSNKFTVATDAIVSGVISISKKIFDKKRKGEKDE